MTRTMAKRKPSTGKTKTKGKPARRPWWARVILWLVALGLVVALLGTAALAGLFFIHGRDPSLPRMSSVRDYRPKMVTQILDRNGILVGELSAERRTVVPYGKIPTLLVRAVVASEDADFFKHQGLDYMGMLRAFFANLRAGRFAQGGSTITQQVVKTFFLTPERTIKRKVQEVILARRLESELSKQEILFIYLYQIYLGHGRYGVQEASRFYFGKDVDKLALGQLALLAGLPQSPERLSPLKHPERAKRRQLYVLAQMARARYISAADAKRVGDLPIRVVKHRRTYYNEAPEFTDIVRAQLVRTFGEEKLSTLGLQVHTTLDAKLQLAAQEAVQWGLRALDARQGFRRRTMRLKGKRLRRWRARLQRTQKQLLPGRRFRAIVTRVDDAKEQLEVDLGPRQGRVQLESSGRYNPQKHAPSRRFAPGDLIWVTRAARDRLRFAGGPQAAMVVMEPQTGNVLAMVGAYEYLPGGFNRATAAKRQPGSAFKPFVYGAALDSGKYTPATIVDDAPVVIGGWEPKNFDGKHRGPVRLRLALAHSINTVAARLMDDIGVDRPRKLAADLGITSPLGKDLSLAHPSPCCVRRSPSSSPA